VGVLLRVRTLIGLVILLAIAYLAVSWVFSDKLLAAHERPRGAVDPAAYGLPKPALVDVPGDGVKLSSWFFANPRTQRCAVIMLHGFGGARGEVVGAAPIFWNRGCDLLLYDSRGHGTSTPALLTFGVHERQDLRLAIRWLAQRTKLPVGRIGLIGWSYGAASAIQAAAEVPGIAFVVADSSYSSLEDIARVQAGKQFGSWAKILVPGALKLAGIRAGFDPGNASPASAIRRVQAPVLLIHSRQDAFTPYQHSQRIYASSDKARTRLVIPSWQAPHASSYTERPAAYTAVVDSFLRRYDPTFGVRRS
jgi:pimeloyl-ACP methyl ester carboxylesterase